MQSGRVVIGRFKPEGFLGAAFLALLPTPELFRIGDVDSSAVLIPSAPVPVGGSLLLCRTRRFAKPTSRSTRP